MTKMMDRLSELLCLQDAPLHVQSMTTIDLLWSEKQMFNMINMLEQAIHDVGSGHRDGDEKG
ncbi:TraU family protein, partial [Cobetia sp. 1CM21F]|uniref:TraU family protein n=1 Tax=Cobetia sp. 1CM21F TaxID=2929163 RepID=UPI0020BF9284